jgi:hypothetical protein
MFGVWACAPPLGLIANRSLPRQRDVKALRAPLHVRLMPRRAVHAELADFRWPTISARQEALRCYAAQQNSQRWRFDRWLQWHDRHRCLRILVESLHRIADQARVRLVDPFRSPVLIEILGQAAARPPSEIARRR